MRKAVIDLGTNTFNLAIAEVKNNSIQLLHAEKEGVAIGMGGINDKLLSEDAIQRAIACLERFKSRCTDFQVAKIEAIGTSAIRDASNKQTFLKSVKDATGIEIDVINGIQEANLIYQGIAYTYNFESPSLIMDIGGGSTEFIIADGKRIYWKHSFDLGAARLLEVINPSEPITKQEIKKLKLYLKEQLALLWGACEIYQVKTLIGSSGSFDSISEMIYYKFHTEENPLIKTEYHFDLKNFEFIYKLLINSTIEKRFKMKGLAAMRVEMIVVAVIMIKYVFKKLKLKEMRLSTYSLKEGILYDYMYHLQDKIK
jgi:exopolyphosphatase/guanosine-5'-triphosphate,3'-diphosphate pyrophosphatase